MAYGKTNIGGGLKINDTSKQNFVIASGQTTVKGDKLKIVNGQVAKINENDFRVIPYESRIKSAALSTINCDKILQIDDTHFLTLVRNSSNQVRLCIFRVNPDETISYGLSNEIYNVDSTYMDFKMYDENIGLFAYMYNDTNDYGRAIVFNVNKVTLSITIGTATVFQSVKVWEMGIAFLSATKAIIFFRNFNQSHYCYASLITISSLSFSVDSTTVIYSQGTYDLETEGLDSSRALLVIESPYQGTDKANVVTISGSTLIPGTTVDMGVRSEARNIKKVDIDTIVVAGEMYAYEIAVDGTAPSRLSSRSITSGMNPFIAGVEEIIYSTTRTINDFSAFQIAKTVNFGTLAKADILENDASDGVGRVHIIKSGEKYIAVFNYKYTTDTFVIYHAVLTKRTAEAIANQAGVGGETIEVILL